MSSSVLQCVVRTATKFPRWCFLSEVTLEQKSKTDKASYRNMEQKLIFEVQGTRNNVCILEIQESEQFVKEGAYDL